jgi:hypothetical protein
MSNMPTFIAVFADGTTTRMTYLHLAWQARP